MAHTAEAWPQVELMLGAVVATGAIDGVGWRNVSRRTPQRFGPGRLAAFLGGLGAIALAVASPLDALAGQRLSAHMTQHLLLMMVAPPLLWLGAPVAPMLRGLPRRIRRSVAAGLASHPVRTAAHVIAHPAFGWVSFTAAFWAWHAPRLYELALRSHAWHHLEHACFFAAAWLAMEALASPGQPTPQGTTLSRPRDLGGSEHEAAGCVDDPNAPSIPPHVTVSQMTGFALAATKVVLGGGVGRMPWPYRSER